MSQYMSKLRNIARDHCANWNVGKCLGCMVRHSEGNRIVNVIDSDMAGEDCIVGKGGQDFEEVVIPGITDERQRSKAKISRRIS